MRGSGRTFSQDCDCGVDGGLVLGSGASLSWALESRTRSQPWRTRAREAFCADETGTRSSGPTWAGSQVFMSRAWAQLRMILERSNRCWRYSSRDASRVLLEDWAEGAAVVCASPWRGARAKQSPRATMANVRIAPAGRPRDAVLRLAACAVKGVVFPVVVLIPTALGRHSPCADDRRVDCCDAGPWDLPDQPTPGRRRCHAGAQSIRAMAALALS